MPCRNMALNSSTVEMSSVLAPLFVGPILLGPVNAKHVAGAGHYGGIGLLFCGFIFSTAAKGEEQERGSGQFRQVSHGPALKTVPKGVALASIIGNNRKAKGCTRVLQGRRMPCYP